MDFFLGLIGVLIIAGVIATVIFGFFSSVWSFIQLDLLGINKRIFRENLSPRVRSFLSAYPYYHHLSGQGKDKFTRRVSNFIFNKEFIGANGMIVTDEMKIKIAASAVQLTFGLEKFLIAYFSTIIVYPDSFYSRMAGGEVKGATTLSGKILISWKDFMEGYNDPADRYNLGLHEMAHALKIEFLHGSDSDEKFSFFLEKWINTGIKEFEKIRGGNSSFIRSYGGKNIHEFFAVCIEHFFEWSSEFNKRLPELYQHLCLLLNQNPLNTTEDYSLSKAEITHRNKILSVGLNVFTSMNWPYTVILTGIFAGWPALIYFMSIVYAEPEELLYRAIFILALGFLVHAALLKKGIGYLRIFLFYSFFGFLPVILSVCLALNQFIVIEDKMEETYRLTGKHTVARDKKNFIVFLENGQYLNDENLRKVNTGYKDLIKKGNCLKITFRKGIFGLKYFFQKEITRCE
ncbi:MAG: zinc-dependent peptidase [Bacteroidetes bacterium]|nr:zinc-dependent peptidase [Bacteroidota bacterium]